NGLGNHGTKPTWPANSNQNHESVEEKNENVTHRHDGIKANKLKNSARLPNSPPTAYTGSPSGLFRGLTVVRPVESHGVVSKQECKRMRRIIVATQCTEVEVFLDGAQEVVMVMPFRDDQTRYGALA